MTPEELRLQESKKKNWKKWGPYLTERQWGTVREDYSYDGNAWGFITHEQARSKAYRWGEEGIGGISDEQQNICLAFAFWNGKDPLIKERLFGLTGHEGNHGEDVKELYYYLDSTPTHSYMKMLYKYPQKEFPYTELVHTNRSRNRNEPEYELLDTKIFDKDEYFDIFLEYAKADSDDLIIKATIHNRAAEAAQLAIMPTIWFRNTWTWHQYNTIPEMRAIAPNAIALEHQSTEDYYVYFDDYPLLLFCNNETNVEKLYHTEGKKGAFYKDGINEFVVAGKRDAVNGKHRGTKACGLYNLNIKGGESATIQVRLSRKAHEDPFENANTIMELRKQEADEFYAKIQAHITDEDVRHIQRQAFAGMMWGKQFYCYNVKEWIDSEPNNFRVSATRKNGRNSHWKHINNADIISMPDKWEYPWYAAWDSAFHCVPIAIIDPDFAKNQLLLFLSEAYMHPNGQIPAYEWNFGDVNPPVHAWSVMRVYRKDKNLNGGKGDMQFLERAFHKLLLNFTWWVNRKDDTGNNIFEGGFLGLDNIGVFDRSSPLPTGGHIEQADGTGWMAMYSLNMLRIAIELAEKNPVYQDLAGKFFEHFLHIAGAINGTTINNEGLWDSEDNFFYDMLCLPDGHSTRLKVRSIVGLIPLFAVETLKSEAYEKMPEFRKKLNFFSKNRPQLAGLVSRYSEPGKGERRLMALLNKYRIQKVLERMLDESEFLSDYGIRALSRYHKKNPYEFNVGGEYTLTVDYQPGESTSSMFGGNSNWRGPIWFPINYLIFESLLKYYDYYGDDFKIEHPKGSGKMHTLKDIAFMLCHRLMNIFREDSKGKRPVYHGNEKMQNDPHFKDHLLFYEYFHGDNGSGLGANHQTGWTGIIAEMMNKVYKGV